MKGDEFVSASMIGRDAAAIESSRIRDGDTVIFYNYRGDRPRELVRALMMSEFEGEVQASPDSGRKGFDRGEFLNLKMENLKSSFEKQNTKTLSEVISNYGELKEKFKGTPWIEFFED